MALAFKKLTTSNLGPKDLLGFGKFKGCRVCDVWDDHYEYLIWTNKAGYVKFSEQVIAHLHERGNFVKVQEHYDNEVKPWLDNPDEFTELPF